LLHVLHLPPEASFCAAGVQAVLKGAPELRRVSWQLRAIASGGAATAGSEIRTAGAAETKTETKTAAGEESKIAPAASLPDLVAVTAFAAGMAQRGNGRDKGKNKCSSSGDNGEQRGAELVLSRRQLLALEVHAPPGLNELLAQQRKHGGSGSGDSSARAALAGCVRFSEDVADFGLRDAELRARFAKGDVDQFAAADAAAAAGPAPAPGSIWHWGAHFGSLPVALCSSSRSSMLFWLREPSMSCDPQRRNR
jgi:hypothetical protein